MKKHYLKATLLAAALLGPTFALQAQTARNAPDKQAQVEAPYADISGSPILLGADTASSRFYAENETIDGYRFDYLAIAFGDFVLRYQYPAEGFPLQTASAVPPFAAVLRLPNVPDTFVGVAYFRSAPMPDLKEPSQMRYLKGVMATAPEGQHVEILKGPVEGNRGTVLYGMNTREFEYVYVGNEDGAVLRHVQEYLTEVGDGSWILSRYEGAPRAFDQISTAANQFLTQMYRKP